jgi:hypothetical protein
VQFLLSKVFSLIAFAKKPGKKGYPQFNKHTRSVEYKTSGWKLSTDKRCLTFTDGFAAGTFKLVGSRDWHFYAARLSELELFEALTATDLSFVSMWNEHSSLFRLVKPLE